MTKDMNPVQFVTRVYTDVFHVTLETVAGEREQ